MTVQLPKLTLEGLPPRLAETALNPDVVIIAAGPPKGFREDIAAALRLSVKRVAWVQSAPAVEELLLNTERLVHAVVISPQLLDVNAINMAEFVGRTRPETNVVWV